MVMCREQYAKEIDRAVFPGIQGGPLMHIIAAKAVAFQEALSDGFRAYQQQIVKSAKRLSARLMEQGFRVVSGGTDNHVFLLDVAHSGLTGKVAEKALEAAGITVNKNTIPYDPNPPLVASGIRIGTPALTTREMKETEMDHVGDFIAEVLQAPDDESVHTSVRGRIRELCERFPLYDPLM
jgi:glycine hydroxymethyltransferase